VRRWLLSRSPYYRDWKAGEVRVDWQGKVAVVTGASSGIGAAMAKRLAREGLKVVLVARRRDRLEDLAGQIRQSGGEASVIAADLAEEEERLRVFDQVQTLYGGVDVLVNSAGVGWYGFGTEMPWSLARQMIQTNMSAVVHLTLLFLSDMKARNRGHIVNIGSVVGNLPSQGVALYGATKSFLDAFTTALHRELRGTNVHVSVAKPGAVSTEFYETTPTLAFGLRVPAKRLAVSPRAVVDRIWGLIKRPRRVAYVPRLLAFVPWVELLFGWLIDRIGPMLLRRQLKLAQRSSRG
jgi:short-subunit dehydrogenase